MEGLYKNKYRAQSIRLKDWNYADNGYYYVTFCTQIRENIFGDIRSQKMVLNNAGKLAQDFWLQIPKHFDNAILDDFIIMPDHIHGIIILDNENIKQNLIKTRLDEGVETLHCNVSKIKTKKSNKICNSLLYNASKIKNQKFNQIHESLQCNDSTNRSNSNNFYSQISPKPKSISTIIRSFKSICSKTINKLPRQDKQFIWQAGFYDHLIRNEKDYLRIKKYIYLNPIKWDIKSKDQENHNDWMKIDLK